jgi:hypothetical protein
MRHAIERGLTEFELINEKKKKKKKKKKVYTLKRGRSK